MDCSKKPKAAFSCFGRLCATGRSETARRYNVCTAADFSDFDAPFSADSTVFDCVVFVTKAGVGRVKRVVG